jgi:hypothetical protein
MEKHTPGPWEVFTPQISGNTFGIDGPRGEAVVFFGRDKENGIYSIHNARLIAAAPELLEALENLLKAVEWTETKPVHHLTRLGRGMAKAKIAIAKAAGEQK